MGRHDPGMTARHAVHLFVDTRDLVEDGFRLARRRDVIIFRDHREEVRLYPAQTERDCMGRLVGIEL